MECLKNYFVKVLICHTAWGLSKYSHFFILFFISWKHCVSIIQAQK